MSQRFWSEKKRRRTSEFFNVAFIQKTAIIAVMAKETRGGARPNTGPKPKAAEERRRNRIMLNLNDTEYDLLCKAAGDEPLSNYARRILVRHLSRRIQ